MTDFLDLDRLATFFQTAGFRVHRSDSAAWYEAGPRFLLGVPTHHPLALQEREAREVLRSTGALGLRYITSEETRGRTSWQMSMSGSDYSLENLSGNTRSKVRRGLKNTEIRRIDGSELARAGEQAFIDTVERQGRADRYGVDRWHQLLAAADADPAVELWASWHGEVLAAYLLVMVFDGSCEFYEARSRSDTLRYYPNNALIHTVAEEMLVSRGIPRITFGIEGLQELDSLDSFKLKMGFEKTPVRQHVVFHPAVRAALGVPPVRMALSLLARRPSASFWRRAEGLLEFADVGRP
ncbi:MAG: GNAT family N-acetyltransferase [Candidatus Binatia bacterium]